MNEVALFEQQNLEAFKQLAELKRQQDALKKQEDEVKSQIEKSMEEYGVKSLKNEHITISYIEASSSTSIDLKALENKEPDLYKELLADYPKVTNRKASVRFTVK